jgi:oligopeptide/dipeptide ABC transporter ATP-binding protein
MYAGYVVERGSVQDLASSPRHPYTRGLMAAMPQIDARTLPEVIVGQPPDLATLPPGCPFAPRCPQVRDECSGVDMDALTTGRCACPFSVPGGEEGEAVRMQSTQVAGR